MNKLTVDQLKKEKAKMDIDFEAHQLKPGDTGFEYDKRVTFDGPREDGSWDDGNDFDESDDSEMDF